MAKDLPATFPEIVQHGLPMPPPSVDAASPFAVPLPSNHVFIDTDQEPDLTDSPAVDYEHHSEMYNLSSLEGRQEYDRIHADVANDHKKRLRRDEIHWTKEGDCLVLIQWVVLKRNPAKEAAERQRMNEDVNSKFSRDD